MPSNKWGPEFTYDKGFYGWGSTEEQATQNAVNLMKLRANKKPIPKKVS